MIKKHQNSKKAPPANIQPEPTGHTTTAQASKTTLLNIPTSFLGGVWLKVLLITCSFLILNYFACKC